MTYHRFDDLIGDLTPEQRARVEALKNEVRAEIVTYSLKELRLHRKLTQTELARRLERAQTSVSAMESAADNLVSTLRMAVEGMGGRLEVTAVFDDERIPLTTHTRSAYRQRRARQDAFVAVLQELTRRAEDPRFAVEQQEARCLLADLEQSLRELEYGQMNPSVDRDAKPDDAGRASTLS